MNKHRFSILLAAGALLGLSACDPKLSPDQPVSANGLDFTRYVSVGNSLTAGYADGTLYRSGQANAYPVMLSSVFNRVMPSPFGVPFLPGESGWPGAKRVLGLSADCQGVTSLGPVLYTGDRSDTSGSSTGISPQGPYNNLGVPGIRAIDFLIPGYPMLNPYAKRFFVNPLGRPTEQLSVIQPTFFTMWVGNNDVLAYATSGGSGKSSNGGFLDQNSISSTTLFNTAIDSILNRLMPAGSTAKGAVISIPAVTAVPFFTTIPYNGLTLTRQGQVDSLNIAYQPAGISFTLGANPFLIQDNSVPVLKFRKAKQGEYILLTVPQDSLKCAGWGSKKPIPAQYVLDATEAQAVMVATDQYNVKLRAAAAARGLAFVDIGSYLATIIKGIQYNGVTFNTSFVRGGAISLDGIHLTPRGNALVANEIIRTINAHYGSTLPYVDVNAYNGVLFP